MRIQIRKLTAQDAPQIAELLKEIGWFETFKGGPIAAASERLRSHIEQCHLDDSHSAFVAESPDGKIVGYGSVHWLPIFSCRDWKGMFQNCSCANPRAGKASVENSSRPSRRRRGPAAVCDCP